MDMDVEAMEVDVKEVEMEVKTKVPPPKRAKRECPICHKTYQKLTDHLHKKHKLTDWVQRQPYMQEAIKKTPDLRVQSK